MKLIVGLGNPGKEYKNTRHNVGFIILDTFLGKVEWKMKMESHFYITEINGEEVIFIKPITYMNLSGLSVKKVVNFYKIDIRDILIIQDDLDLELGNYKIKRNSSSGGHNGIKSIIHELNNDEFGRLKIGVGKSDLIPIDKYVLNKFSSEELKIIQEKMDIYKKVIKDFIENGIEKALENNKKN